MAEISPKTQQDLVQYQQIQQQLQTLLTQKYQMEVEEAEIKRTLEELKKLKDTTPIYKSIGAVMFKVEDRKALISELEEKKETIGIRIQSLERQEKALKERYEALQRELATALKQ